VHINRLGIGLEVDSVVTSTRWGSAAGFLEHVFKSVQKLFEDLFLLLDGM
jgi:hypothetical protein